MIKGITAILNTNATFQGLAGMNKAGVKYKSYPVICTQPEEAPYSVIRITAKRPFGQCKDANSTFEYSFDVDSFHKNFEDVEALDNAVMAALDNVSGTYGGVTFQVIRFESMNDNPFIQEYSLFSRTSSFIAIV